MKMGSFFFPFQFSEIFPTGNMFAKIIAANADKSIQI